jgi:superfamily II DNA/RNA helicase
MQIFVESTYYQMSFKELGLNENLLKAIEECGYTEPTPIQAQAIPHILMARDVVGLAQTGTGKTASFTLPMIEILAGGRAKARMPRSLILSPTRELAAQIAQNFDVYGKYHKLTKAVLVGGTSMEDQIRLLDRGVDVLIATPGRMLDLFERGKILLTDIKILVIDEADRMLDMGFIPDIEKIVGFLSPMRQTLLFSATMPPAIKKLTTKFLSNPREVSVAPPASTSERVEQFLIWTDSAKKKKLLSQIIRQENVQNAFIFCNRKRDIAGVEKWLRGDGYSVESMHGDLSQEHRTKTLKAFKEEKITLLVCSDVAARGLDVDGMSHVFNFDVPTHADDYVHRIGRTGRAGKDGRAWTIATKSEEKYVTAIESLIKGTIKVEKIGGAAAEKAPEKAAPKVQSQPVQKPAEKAVETQTSGPSEHQEPRHQGRTEFKHNKPDSERRPAREHHNHDNDDDAKVQGFGSDVPGFFGKQ